MSDFDPGPGWRRLANKETLEHGAEVINWSTGDGIRAWVRVEPVPPLPTETYTVIRVTWDSNHQGLAWPAVLTLGAVHDWAWSAEGVAIDVVDLPKWITGFKILAEPRAATAKAVIDRAHQEVTNVRRNTEALDDIAREFGVSDAG